MTLSRNATAFSIDAILSRQDTSDSEQTRQKIVSTAIKPVSNDSNRPYPILDAAFSTPLQHKSSDETRSDVAQDQDVVSTGPDTLPHDFASSFASIESRLRQISVRSPGLPIYPTNGGEADKNVSPPRPDISPSSPGTGAIGTMKSPKSYHLEHQLTIPSFKIHSDNTYDKMALGPSPEVVKTDFDRRFSTHSTTSTEKADIEEALACLKYKAAAGIADKPFAVEQWVRSTLQFTPQGNESAATGLFSGHESSPVSQTADGIKVTLVNGDLWKKFSLCGTEMILNRAGRRMFPSILLAVDGLEESALYRVRLHISPADGQRYKFINCQWLPVGKADSDMACTYYEHHDSPNTGAFWMKGNVSFSKLKITNNKENVDKNIVLNSMHKYIPRIVIIKEVRPVSKDAHPQLTQFSFPETTFIAVTAYQNQQITQLKIQNNPFAKAFRDADVAALLQSAHGLSPEMAFGEGYQHHPYVPRRGSSPDYRPFTKLASANETSEHCRRSLPMTIAPYQKQPITNNYLRPPGFASMPWYSKSEKLCRLPRDIDQGGSACSSLSSIASQESGFGDAPFPTEISGKVRLTKSKSTDIFIEKQEQMPQQQAANSFAASGGAGSSSSVTDAYWLHSSNPRVHLPPSHSLSALQTRSPQMSKRSLESSNSVALNLNIPLKRCRSISPASMVRVSLPPDQPPHHQ